MNNVGIQNESQSKPIISSENEIEKRHHFVIYNLSKNYTYHKNYIYLPS